jgi:hypothetical protein
MHAYLVSLLILCAQVGAEPDAPESLDKQVRALVLALDDDDLDTRNQAEESLIKLGPAILDRLPRPDENTSIEVRERLARLRTTLEKAEIEAFSHPTKITLQGKMKLSEALRDIERQTGNRVFDHREQFGETAADPEVTLDLTDVPFWQGLDQLLDAANVKVYNYGDPERIGALPLVAREEGETARSGRGVYAGLFRLEPQRVEASRNILLPEQSQLAIAVDLAWEPRIRPIVLLVPLVDLVATDNRGESIPLMNDGTLEIPVEGPQSGVETVLSLALPSREAKSVQSLQGKFIAIVTGRVETFEFSDLVAARNVVQERGGAVVTHELTSRNDDLQEIRIRLKFDKAANALESHRGWVYNNEHYLLNAAGERVESAGTEARLVEENEVGLSFLFDLSEQALASCKFVYKTPAAIHRLPVSFELRDIPLP